jgi:hypothetical protein
VALTSGCSAQHVATVKRLRRGEPLGVTPTFLGLAVAVVLILIGALMTVYLATTS